MPCDGFNIDHIVIGPRAVYAVETKSIRKPQGSDDDSHYKVTFDGTALSFPDFQNRKAVEQARRQAHWLRRYLKESLGLDIPVVPAIALPGWWIDKTESGRNSDVKVFTPMGRGAEFLATGEEIIGASLRSLIAQAIAQRYPSVDD
jgi:Nuclease-related domain.